MSDFLFTSESVTEGHPDKICDRISDSILDQILAKDPLSRVACEAAITTGLVLVMGEISTSCYIDITKIVRQTIINIGYDRAKYGFDGHTCGVITSIDEQSPDIALGVNNSLESKLNSNDNIKDIGAGDQGIMFGYACNETPEFMPLPISLAHKLAKQLTLVRKNSLLNYLRPDGKTQVTVEYHDNIPYRVDTVIISCQHNDNVDYNKLKSDIIEAVIMQIIPPDLIDNNTRILINPTGRFVIGGPQGDSGLTGRKIIVDTYGGFSRHGGGAFSGKDPTKVDRSACYAARHIAKNIVASGISQKCEVQLSYSIGVSNPISIMVDTFGTGKYSNQQISNMVSNLFELSPSAIIKRLDLLRPIYGNLSAYGHMGREELNVGWEKLDMIKPILSYF